MTAFVGCGSSSNNPTGPGNDAGAPGTAQSPPTTNAADVEAWLAGGQYKAWACEPMPHAPRGPSVHAAFNRICSNQLVHSNATGTGVWPVGAANVKELYNAASDPAPEGYAVYVKTAADESGGTNWFYYERVQDGTVYANAALGVPVCVSCHQAAGSDAAHTTSPGSRDFVYTAVP
jgi:hypothetical protein